MLIKEVCEKCKLTKKAIEYYESKNLISPQILENGYRDYSDADIAILKEIHILRRCGISTTDIAQILKSSNKLAALKKCKYIAELRMQRLSAMQKCMTSLIEDYDVDRVFDDLQTQEGDLYTIKEKLALAFPGDYGLFISMHFGRFLNGVIQTKEQQKAYEAIVQYLDDVNLYFSDELSGILKSIFEDRIDAVRMEEETSSRMQDMLNDPEDYLNRNKEQIEDYLKYKFSDEYKDSEATTMQKLMLDFQKNSGYQEVFLANMKILSPSYAEYLNQLEIVNNIILDKYPILKELYEEK